MTERERIILATAIPAAQSSARPFLPMLGRDPPAVGVLRRMAEPILDIGDEPPGGDQIPYGMVVVQRLIPAH
jgi:hypothetical protein